MKRLMIAAMMVLAIGAGSGCANKNWDNYVADNGCKFSGDQAMRRQLVSTNLSSTIPAANGGSVGGSSSIPMVEMRPVYKYNCNNGDIWAYYSPKR